MTKTTEFSLLLNPEAVLNPLTQVLEESAQNVLYGLRLLESVDVPVEAQYMSGDDTFITFMPAGEREPTPQDPVNFKLWLLRKGIEDLIKGLNLTLAEAHLYIDIIKTSGKRMTIQDFENEIAKLKKSASKLHLPVLLERLAPQLTSPLSNIEQIKSLNNVRNCLVHRNGLVSDLDINDIENQQLKMEFTAMKLSIVSGDEQKAMGKYEIITAESQMKLEFVKESISFKIGDTINFSYPQFTACMSTCAMFGNDLVTKLPTT